MNMKRILIFLLISFQSLLWAQNLQISGGNSFSAAVCDNQIVYAWGSNASGQLGIDSLGNTRSITRSDKPLSVGRGILPAIKQIDAGSGGHLMGLDCNNNVWVWGENNFGQKGQGGAVSGTGTPSPTPQKVLKGAQVVAGGDPTFLSNISYVSGGNNSSYAIERSTGKVLAWGENTNGQLGDGTTVNRSTPIYVQRAGGGPLTNIIQIEGGDDCAFALDVNGNVWSWGTNNGAELGRAGTAPAITYVADRVRIDTDFNGSLDADLSNILQISAGDAHGLALDNAGNVWSWGGDWGPGQRGLGKDYQGYGGLEAAYRVLAVGATDYRIGPYLANATFIAAGQASSAVVLSDGRVVTFGSNGLFTGNLGADPLSCPDPGTPGDNNVAALQSGTLGTAGLSNQACTNFTRNDAANSPQGAISPVYVLKSSTPGDFLTGITSVSDGDAWFFATGASGNTFAWGWNRRGELGLGDLIDRNFATSFALPTGCTFANPCPGTPFLPSDIVTCPVFSTIINSQVPQTYSSYKYQWYYRAGTNANGVGTNPWTLVEGTITPTLTGDSAQNRVNQLGQYKVEIRDTRSTVPFLCGPCPVQRDSMTITERPNPYTVTACADAGASKGKFDVITPTTSKIKWYTNLTGGTALNPTDSALSLTTTFANINTTIPGCSRALFAEDLGSIQGTLFSTGATIPTTAQIAAGVGCAVGSWSTQRGKDAYLAVRPTRNIRLTSVSLYINNTNNYTLTTGSVAVYNNNANNSPNTGSQVGAGYPIGTIPANTARVIQVPVNINLLANTIYWIRAEGTYNEQPVFDCDPASTTNLWNTPTNDNTGQTILRAVSGWDNGNLGGRGSVFDIKFEAGTGYTCGRILVCATNTCVLPVEFVKFDVTKNANLVNLNWATSFEENASSFKIMRSINGQNNFEVIGEVNSNRNSQVLKEYNFVDHVSKGGGTFYYMIVETDANGKQSTTDIKAINVNFQNSEISVVPNPNQGNFVLNAKLGEQSNVALKLYDAVGKLVLEDFTNTGTFSKNIELTGVTSGVYFLHIIGTNEKWIEKIIKD